MAKKWVHKYPAFEDFLADNVVNTVVDLLAVFPKANGVFKEHVTRVITAADNYGKYLRKEYDRAEKNRFTDRQKLPEGGDYQWFEYPEWGDIYFDSPDAVPAFWMKGRPKPNPLAYLCSMVWGCISRQPTDPNPLNYQYFLIACIYDSQRHAEQRQIYFDLKPKDSPLWDKELEERICRRVWDTLVKRQKSFPELDRITKTISEAAQAIEADLQMETPSQSRPEWSQPMSLTKWAKVFDVHRNTMRLWFKEQTIRNEQISERRWRVDINELPADIVKRILTNQKDE